MYYRLAPSILSANFGKLEAEIRMLNHSLADWIHVDIMDGLFVPNISFGFPVLKVVNEISEKPLDVHLMIEKPERYFEDFQKYGAKILTIHYEACTHLHRNLAAIKELGMQCGVVLNPHTPINLLEDVVKDVDMVLIMSVNPGYGGQKFIENSYSKISRLKELILKKSSGALIEVDGGVTLENTPRLLEAGVDVLVAGNSIFSTENPEKTIALFKSLKPAQ